MLTPKLPDEQKDVVALPQAVTVVASEEATQRISFVLPPIEDIAEIEELAKSCFSLEAFVEEQRSGEKDAFESAFVSLSKKASRFEASPRYLVKLADLAHLTERFELESEIVRAAAEIAKTTYYFNRLGDNLVRQGRVDEAEKKFEEAAKLDDVTGLMRLAALCVTRQEFSAAERLVARAVQLDGADFSARLFEGALHLVAGRFDYAIRSMRVALQERPNSSAAHCNIAIAHLGVRQQEKALSALKRAAALDPLNANAVALLADVAFSLRVAEDSITSLRYFVSFEQANAGMWSRLARAAFVLGKPDESLGALKRQAGLQDSAGVWNNMGVAYAALHNGTRAKACFSHAMRIGADRKDKSFFLAAKNFGRNLAHDERIEELQTFTSKVLEMDSDGTIFRDRQLSDLVVLDVFALIKLRRISDAEALSIEYLSREGIADSLAVWLVGVIAAMRSLQNEEVHAEKLLETYEANAERIKRTDSSTAERFFNNIAFALAETGKLKEAEDILSRISHRIHVSAYPTATFGLIQLKKGRVDRAAELYDEAVSLAKSRSDKTRIRQKFNLEIGRFWIGANESKARRFLLKATKESNGEPLLADKASALLKALPKPARS